MSQPPPLPYGPTGTLVLVLRSPGWGSRSMISPTATIDGHPAPVQWPSDQRPANVFTVPAGRRHVSVSQTYLWTYGRADQVVDVAPGQTVQVFYAGPLLTFLGGSIGFTPQSRRGVAALVAFLVVLVVFAVGIAVIANIVVR